MSAVELSSNCRAARGKPNRLHVCSGCRDCPCHAVPAPPDFRQRVEAAKAAARDEPGEGA